MAIILGACILNENLIWMDRFKFSPIAQQVNRTIGGVNVVFSTTLIKGVPITLEATQDQGWISKTQLDELNVMQNQPGGTAFTLTYGLEEHQVIFRHFDPPALDISPFVARQTHEVSDYFIGQIKLLTV